MYHPPMNIALISPFHGGSHRAWAEGYAAASAHAINLITLPDRHWKWRMHGGAVTLARRFFEEDLAPDLILATDMLDLTTFLALTRDRTAQTPVALYMHENQLTYPWPDEVGGRPPAEYDRHYAFINLTSMLSADTVIFNSNYHRDTFLAALPEYLKPFPDHNEPGSVDAIRAKSHVLPVGIDLQRLDPSSRGSEMPQYDSLAPPKISPERAQQPPLILWNQRWEHDKNPEAFFDALYHVAAVGIPFQLALCGERYSRWPHVFNDAQERLHDRIIHAGYATPDRYRELLWQADITISTAHHEFFGISILEAVHCQTFPLLPNRLSYPEIIPAEFHPHCLYHDQNDLVARLTHAIQNPAQTNATAKQLAPHTAPYDWSNLVIDYDRTLENLAT